MKCTSILRTPFLDWLIERDAVLTESVRTHEEGGLTIYPTDERFPNRPENPEYTNFADELTNIYMENGGKQGSIPEYVFINFFMVNLKNIRDYEPPIIASWSRINKYFLSRFVEYRLLYPSDQLLGVIPSPDATDDSSSGRETASALNANLLSSNREEKEDFEGIPRRDSLYPDEESLIFEESNDMKLWKAPLDVRQLKVKPVPLLLFMGEENPTNLKYANLRRILHLSVVGVFLLCLILNLSINEDFYVTRGTGVQLGCIFIALEAHNRASYKLHQICKEKRSLTWSNISNKHFLLGNCFALYAAFLWIHVLAILNNCDKFPELHLTLAIVFWTLLLGSVTWAAFIDIENNDDLSFMFSAICELIRPTFRPKRRAHRVQDGCIRKPYRQLGAYMILWKHLNVLKYVKDCLVVSWIITTIAFIICAGILYYQFAMKSYFDIVFPIFLCFNALFLALSSTFTFFKQNGRLMRALPPKEKELRKYICFYNFSFQGFTIITSTMIFNGFGYLITYLLEGSN